MDYRYSEAVSGYEDKIKEKSKHIDYLDKLNQDQSENHENEVRTLKQIIEQQKSELDSEKMKSRERDQQYQETIDDLKSDSNTLRDTLSRERADKEKQIDDLTYELEGTITTLKSKVDSLSSRNGIL
jgi:chromosome segregation ATPase